MVLDDWMDPAVLRNELSDHLVSLGSVADDGSWPSEDGRVFGIPHNIDLKSLVWYPVSAFREAGYRVPESQGALDDLVARIEADGGTPWCHGEWSSGWPGTDWVEDLLLMDAGPQYFDDWVAHEVPFDDGPVRDAFERYAELVLAPDRVYGGQARAAAMSPPEALAGMFADPPRCWLMHQASFAALWFPAGTVPGEDVGVFPMPPEAGADRRTVLGGGAYLVAVTDRPEVREVLTHLVGRDWGRMSIAAGTWRFPANRYFPWSRTPTQPRGSLRRRCRTPWRPTRSASTAPT